MQPLDRGDSFPVERLPQSLGVALALVAAIATATAAVAGATATAPSLSPGDATPGPSPVDPPDAIAAVDLSDATDEGGDHGDTPGHLRARVGTVASASAPEPAVVTRDGTVVPVNVTTRQYRGGPPQNGTVTLQVPDDDSTTDPRYNFSGTWLVGRTDGGQVHSVDDRNDTLTLSTGADGNATAYLRTDDAGVTLQQDATHPFSALDVRTGNYFTVNDTVPSTPENETGVYAYLTDDRSALSYKPVEFVGVKRLREANVNGVVTDRGNREILNATVYTRRIAFADGTYLAFDPAARDANGQPTRFVVSYRRSDGTVLTNATVDRSAVDAAVGDNVDLFERFPRLNRSTPNRFTFVTTTGTAGTERGFYTLPTLPAQSPDGGVRRPVNYDLRAVQNPTGIAGNGSATLDRPFVSDEGNVVVATGGAPNLSVSSVSLDPAVVDPGNESVTVEVGVRNDGAVAERATITVRLNGSVVGSDTRVVPVNRTEQFRVTIPADATTGLAGNATVTVGSDFGVTRTVELGVTGSCRLDRSVRQYDADGSCSIGTSELNAAVGDWVGGALGDAALQDVIAAWVRG